jgi:hypothetical protein
MLAEEFFLFSGEILASLPRFVGGNKLALLRKTGQPAVLVGKAARPFSFSSLELRANSTKLIFAVIYANLSLTYAAKY